MSIVFVSLFATSILASAQAQSPQAVPDASPSPTPAEVPQVLPPLLNRLESGLGRAPLGINVTGQDQKRRRAQIGEWLDFGDSFEMGATEAVTVIQNESFTWVGGGGFQGRILKSEDAGRMVFTLEMKRGWVRVWLKPSDHEQSIEIKANGEVFTSKDGVFWLSSRQGANDLYLEKGEVATQRAKQVFQGKVFAVLPEQAPAHKTSDWDPEAMGVHIARIYPTFVRLVGEVDLQWRQGEIARIYSSLRKKGWRRFHRLAPDIRD